MISAFKCKCGSFEFQIINENYKDTKHKDKTYFRCWECSDDYQLDEVNSLKG